MIRILAGPSRRLAALGILLAGINLGALALHVPGADTVGSPARANAFVAVVTVGLAVYLLAVRLVLRERLPRAAVWMILGLAVAMRAALVPAPPFLSSDIYRYVWDGQVQAAGINPYRYIPADPALEPLRDPAIYPLINRKDYAHTIYPPAAQGVFAAVGQVSRGVTGMKLAMLGFEAMGVLAMLAVLRRAGLPLERILIYAWNPLALWSFACDGHVDAVAVGLLGVALLARTRRRDGLAGALLAAAALVKVLPLAVAPAFVRGGRLWRPVLAGIAVIIVLYLPYLGVGRGVLGFAGSYGTEEGYDTGAGYWLLAGLGHLGFSPPGLVRAYLLCAGLALAALALRIAFGRNDRPGTADAVALCRDAGILAALATCAASPHYAWYYPWLTLPAVVAPLPAVIWLGAAPLLLLIDPFDDRFLWPALVFVPGLVLAARAAWQARRPRPAALLPQGTAR
ncbi:Protein of unknown function [Methylobacterium sp. ap11]|uniref:glycosyltransferase 87 family protein n=1 Tax=Methylobacterium sp. ap11 TaxID=1761799 RepID=UPI0008AAD3FF|nr:glycosyltransferase 87 family protein [Methylobacterium sp. ap11]SEO93477.1 Protein of unknown function [Methylobacterium sp. ap11]